MTLVIPPSVLIQMVVAGIAGVVGMLVGGILMHRAWNYRDHRSERDFLAGFMFATVGLAWLVITAALFFGTTYTSTSQGRAIQELVVFTNAATRITVILIGAHVLLEELKARKTR
jgi:hypothetical protein